MGWMVDKLGDFPHNDGGSVPWYDRKGSSAYKDNIHRLGLEEYLPPPIPQHKPQRAVKGPEEVLFFSIPFYKSFTAMEGRVFIKIPLIVEEDSFNAVEIKTGARAFFDAEDYIWVQTENK